MDDSQADNEPTSQSSSPHRNVRAVLPQDDILNPIFWRKFFALTGGSVFYCVSAIFVAYGIVKVLGPILAESTTLMKALPCIATLHLYEITLLGVLILIVGRKVVDDAISLVILIALFLVGTSIAQGSVAERNLPVALTAAGIGAALALAKFIIMRRWAGLSLGWLAVAGLASLMACNYIGPVFLARSVSVSPLEELARRELWMGMWLVLLVCGGAVVIEALARGPQTDRSQPFLRRPAMAYALALILLAASGLQQYAMAYTFALQRIVGDFAPIITVGMLLAIAMLRSLGKRFGFAEVLLACLPLAWMLWAIYLDDFYVLRELSLSAMVYPPVFFALSGLAVAAVALYCRQFRLLYVVFLYGMGVVLTWGVSHTHPLNVSATLWTLAASLLGYGLVIRNQIPYVAGLIPLCVQVTRIETFEAAVKGYGLEPVGALAGICGAGIMLFYLLFGSRLLRTVRVVGTLCLAIFLYEYMPDTIAWRHLIALVVTVGLATVLWYRDKDAVSVSILAVPILAKLYIVTRRLAYWRVIIVGFVLLAAGALASLRKPSRQDDAAGPDGT
jgi:hypothetical protein